MRFRTVAMAAALAATLLAAPARAQVSKADVPGISNFARVETTVACGGATKPEAVPELKKMGFKSIINLRTADEAGADIEGEAAAARDAGLNYVHIAFKLQDPAPTLVDDFLKAITAPENTPAFIHCTTGGRAAAMWMIKRVEVDGWDEARALEEAEALGLVARTKPFALDYIHAHPKQP